MRVSQTLAEIGYVLIGGVETLTEAGYVLIGGILQTLFAVFLIPDSFAISQTL